MNEHESVLAIIGQKNKVPFTIDRARTALIVIDVQHYFVDAGDNFGQLFERLVPGVTAGYFKRVRERVLPNIRSLQKAFRDASMPILYTATGTRTGDGRDLPGWLRELDNLGLAVLGQRIWPREGERQWQVDESIAPLPGEPVFMKCSSGPVASTRMDQTLRNMGIDTVLVTGLTTDVCTTQTARELADRGFSTVLVEDATTTLSEEMHNGAVQCFNIAFGRVRSTSEVIAMLEQTQTSSTAFTDIPVVPLADQPVNVLPA